MSAPTRFDRRAPAREGETTTMHVRYDDGPGSRRRVKVPSSVTGIGDVIFTRGETKSVPRAPWSEQLVKQPGFREG